SAGATSTGSGEFTPIGSQAELDKIIGERVARERAKFADYKDLKSKAAKLDEIEQANKSELEKAAEARQQAEQERDAARADALRFRVASRFGVSDEDTELFLTASDEATLTKQAERLTQRESERKSNGNFASGEGRSTSPGGNNEDEQFVKDLFA